MATGTAAGQILPEYIDLATLYGISAGPGDPELITLKGLRSLKSAPVVAFPAGVQGKTGVAEQIIQAWLSPEQIRLPLVFPYIQDQRVLEQAWKAAATQVWHYLRQGKDVAFVSEGDVSFYSTFAYLAQTLRLLDPAVEIQAIPGVCSPVAAAAALGIPLTIRRDRLVVLPTLYSVEALLPVLDWADVVVLLKLSSVYPQVWRILEQRQLLQRSYVIEYATTSRQVIHTNLHLHPDLELPYFSLLLIQVTPGPSLTLGES